MKGKSTEIALYELISNAEKAIEHKQYALTAFLDIEGAFNNVTNDAIAKALTKLGVNENLNSWLINMIDPALLSRSSG